MSPGIPSLPNIEGLSYLPGYVTGDEESRLLESVDSEPWLDDLQRRVQHYGYRYDYKARSVTADMKLGPIPTWLDRLGKRMASDGYFEQRPDQVIVNEYEPGQGIAPHADCRPCFGPTVTTLSLASACEMEFRRPHSERAESVLLEPRSLLVLSGPARYEWTHSIAKRKTDRTPTGQIRRSRRVSLTFRTVNVATVQSAQV